MTHIKKKIKAVIFDMDGTIIKTEHIWNAATKGILYKRGFCTFTDEQSKILDSLSGGGLTKAALIIKHEFKLADSIDQLVEETKTLACQSFIDQGIEFIDGFELFHKKLQSLFIPTSIATNADKISLNLLSQKINLDRFFGTNIYGVDHVGNKAKPDPALFLHASKQLNVEPHECVVFEDSVFGFEAANAAGMKCIAIKNTMNKDKLDQVNDAIDSYHEAEEALSRVASF